MKELTTEQKAQRYDEALKVAKGLYAKGAPDSLHLERMFPVLKESKDNEDERIRKSLIDFFSEPSRKNYILLNGFTVNDIIAWLEKQGEQKPVISDDALREGIVHFGITQYQIDNWLKKYVDVEKQWEKTSANKVKPKFKIGDTIVEKDLDECGYGTIKDIKDGQYIFTDGFAMNINEQGGWQLVKSSTNIEQKPAESSQKTEPNGGIVWEDFTEGDGCYKVNLAYLSKSQVELIENLVASWQNPTNNTTAWSKEDERLYKSITYSFAHNYPLTDQQQEFVKSLKDRYTWKPSDEQMDALHYVTNFDYGGHKATLVSLYEQLKKLKG